MESNSESINLTFRRNVGRGVGWSSVAKIGEKSIGYIRLAILARILSPADFGIFGFLLTIMAFFETFSEMGIAEKIIHQKFLDKSLMSSAYIVQILKGFVLAFLTIAFGSLITQFFQIESFKLVYAIALLEVIKSAINPAILLWRKNLLFGKELAYQFSSSVVELIVAVTSALIFKNYWALVLGFLAKVCYQVIYSILSEKIYLLDAKKSSFISLFKFGRWIQASSVLSFLTHEGDDLVVFKMLGSNSLGLYQNAYKFSLVPVTGNVFSGFAYPLISAQKDNQQKLIKTIKLSWAVSYISFILGGIIWLFPLQVTLILLGNDWIEMAAALRVLILYGVLRSIGGILGQYFISIGRPDINTKINFAKFLILLILIFPFIWWGEIVGASLAVVISSLVANALQIWYLSKHQGFWENFKFLIIPIKVLVISLLMASFIKLQFLNIWIDLIFSGSVYLLSFLLLSLFFDQFLKDLFIQICLPKLPKKIRNFIIKTQLKIKRGNWHDFNWQKSVKKASNKDWQKRYDLQWQYDRHDSLLDSDVDWIMENLKKLDAKNILEIGPGTGKLSKKISKEFKNLTAIDISPVVLNNLEFNGNKVLARAEVLPFLQKSVDVIVATHLLEHVEDLDKTIIDWLRVAKKGLIIIVPQEEKPEIVANYHLHYFPTINALKSAIPINGSATTHVNPNDQKKYIRFMGKLN